MYCRISLNRLTVAATGFAEIHMTTQCFWSCRRKRYSMYELILLFGHKLSHLKFEIHVVIMHLSQRRLKICCPNSNSSSNALALKGNGRRHSHWFIAWYAQNTPTNNKATSDQPILDLHQEQESFIHRYSNSARDPPIKLLVFCVSYLRFRPIK